MGYNALVATNCRQALLSLFFFLIQQFITRSARADRGSYNVTTYMTTNTTWERRKKEEKKEKNKEKKKIRKIKYYLVL